MFSPAVEQVEWFRQQVRLACELGKPLFLHERDAHVDFLAVLDEELTSASPGTSAAPPRCCVHCFTGTEVELRSYVERGFYIGITGWITDPRRGQHLLDLVSEIPIDRLMIGEEGPLSVCLSYLQAFSGPQWHVHVGRLNDDTETDAPFLAPRNLRKGVRVQTNEPCLLPYVLQAVADALHLDASVLAEQLAKNTEEFFGITVPATLTV